jgi:ribonuclease P protein component
VVPLRIATLKKRSDFLRIRAARKRWVAPGLILQAAPADAPAPDLVRVGYTASKRVGNAVARNRAKRRLRAAVAHVMPARALRDRDYVVIARTATLTRPFEALKSDLATALGQVGTNRTGERSPSRRRRKAEDRPRGSGSRTEDG